MIQPVDFETVIEAPPEITSLESIEEFNDWLSSTIQQLNAMLLTYGISINSLIVGVLPYADLDISYAAVKSPRPGRVAYADGTSWDPGSGEGLYVYKSDDAWHFIA